MQITDKQTGMTYEVTGSVKRVVQVNDCISFIDADGVTQTVEFIEGETENAGFILAE